LSANPFDQLSILLFLLILLAIIFIAIWIFYIRKKMTPQADPYLHALEDLADGRYESAVEKFKEAIRQNSNNIGAYLRLGDKLREQGYVKSALRIHKELTLRENLTKEDESRINKSLLLDYEKTSDFENGIALAKKLFDENKKNDQWIVEKMIALYERSEKWMEAIETLRKYFKPLTETQKKKIALYLVFQGLYLHQIKRAKEGRIKFKEALKVAPACSAAYFYLGKSYQNENRLEDAIREWQTFCHKVPGRAHIVFPHLEKAYFDKGIFEDLESFYQDLTDLDEKNLNTVLALVEFYLKKGRYERAHIFLEKAEEDFKNSNHLAAKKVEVLYHVNQYKEAASEALKLCKVDYKKLNQNYTCKICKFESKDPQWRCPQCKSIDSFSI